MNIMTEINFNELVKFAKEIKIMYTNGSDLREISKYSYQQRESGRNTPYLAHVSRTKLGRLAHIVASPTDQQLELKQFFSEKRNGSKIYPKYILKVDIDTGVEFTENTINNGCKVVIDLTASI